jgi:hypothetical protein
MRTDRIVTTLRRVTAFSAAAMLVAGANPARADNNRTIAVSGSSVASECGVSKKADLGLELTGNLTGCWAIFIQHFNCRELNGFALYTELGREEFDGRVNGKPTKFDTQYTVNATFPSGSCPAPDFVKEITGGCIHYVSGKDLGGLITFHDVITPGQGPTSYFYYGTLTRDDG